MNQPNTSIRRAHFKSQVPLPDHDTRSYVDHRNYELEVDFDRRLLAVKHRSYPETVWVPLENVSSMRGVPQPEAVAPAPKAPATKPAKAKATKRTTTKKAAKGQPVAP